MSNLRLYTTPYPYQLTIRPARLVMVEDSCRCDTAESEVRTEWITPPAAPCATNTVHSPTDINNQKAEYPIVTAVRNLLERTLQKADQVPLQKLEEQIRIANSFLANLQAKNIEVQLDPAEFEAKIRVIRRAGYQAAIGRETATVAQLTQAGNLLAAQSHQQAADRLAQAGHELGIFLH